MLAFQRTVVISALAALAFTATPARATDGVIEINQARALAGAVTPSDTPGFPVTLGSTGSYRLTSNLTVPGADTTAIRVAANNVAVDLNGFSILGPTVCTGAPPSSPITCAPTGTGRGIDASGAAGTTIANGTVRGMGSHGIWSELKGRVEKVHALSNGGHGIALANLFGVSVVNGNIVELNGGDGIQVGSGTVSGNVVEMNGQSSANWGIIVIGAGTVSDNTVQSNTGLGIASNSGTVTANVVESNGASGILTSVGTVSGNTVRGNTANGITGLQLLVSNNAVQANAGAGIVISGRGTVIGNDVGNNGLVGLAATPSTGYVTNTFGGNNGGGGQVSGGFNLGQNLCGAALCP